MAIRMPQREKFERSTKTAEAEIRAGNRDPSTLIGEDVCIVSEFAGVRRKYLGSLLEVLPPLPDGKGGGLRLDLIDEGPMAIIPLSGLVSIEPALDGQQAAEELASAAPSSSAVTPEAAADDHYPGDSLSTLPAGQKQTWHQWCSGAGHPPKDRTGAAWEAYMGGVKPSRFKPEYVGGAA